ncbi:MAG: alpha/beta hydrolase [Chloroflexi bacterium]|nr:alpha/beta hydrolase [Chloroflexota bacterium]MYJ92999.1 alpha/beta hydrolase [Chloroflexota bacterium]
MVTSSANDLNYVIDGPTDGRPVLFVHGILTCRAHWLLNLPAFHEAGFRSIAIDLLGHGSSPAPEAEAAYHPDRYVERFCALRELVEAERWFVVGQSLGAALTLNYAMSRPDEVIAHVVTNSHSAFGELDRIRNPASARERAQLMIDGGIDAVMRHPLNPRRARAFDDAQRSEFDDAMLLSQADGIARTMMYTSPHTPLRHRLPDNPVDTLLVAGDREEAFTPAREWVEEHAANFRVERVSATHAVNISAADDFNRIAIEFLNRFP